MYEKFLIIHWDRKVSHGDATLCVINLMKHVHLAYKKWSAVSSKCYLLLCRRPSQYVIACLPASFTEKHSSKADARHDKVRQSKSDDLHECDHNGAL